MMKYKVEKATKKDGKEMLDIIEETASKGNLQLIYTRRPDAFLSYQKEKKDTEICIIKDNKGKIAVQGSCIVNDYYINGSTRSIGYVGGIRKRKGFKEKFNWVELFTKDISKRDCDLFYCSFLALNKHALEVFQKKREVMPELVPITKYFTYIINPKIIKFRKINSEFCFRKMEDKDKKKVVEFLNIEGCKYNFFPKVSNIEKEFPDLKINDCYILEKDDEIISFGGLWNQKEYKQYIVKKYGGFVKILSKIGAITECIGYIPMPKENEVLNFPTLSLFIAKDDNLEYYEYFLRCIAKEIAKKYKMFVIGISENNKKNEIYKKLKSLKFDSLLFLVDFKGRNTKLEEDIHIECGLL